MAIRLDEARDELASLLVSLEERGNIDIPARGRLKGFHSLRQRSISGRPDCRVLLPDELLRFRRPRHQLAVERYPVGAELLPEPCLVQGPAYHVEQFPLYGRVVEETATRPSVADPDAFTDDAEPSTG